MKAFIDTNVVVYALAHDDAQRRGRALDLIAQYGSRRELVLSTQVLIESYHVLTRKKGAAPEDALAALRLLARHEVVVPDADVVLRALALAIAQRLSTWDALIVQCALEAGCEALLSEDLQTGRRFGALEVVNPFLDASVRVAAKAPTKRSRQNHKS